MQTQLTRRAFLARSAAASAGMAIPYFIPDSVLAAPSRPGANERIHTGHIGVGGMGSGHLQGLAQMCVAICDVDKRRLAKAAEITGGKAKTYTDYRQLLENKDVDAVFIATPDHWHALTTIHACQAGKDVYCEKPACNTIAEGRAMVEAAQRYGRIIQIGSQGRSTPAAHAACTYIRNGMIGKVSKVTCWHYANPVGGFQPDGEPPPDLDYDMWLGPARWRPYNVDCVHGNFRWLLEFGGGQIRDRGAHVMSVAMWLMNSDHTGPVSVEASGEPPKEGLWDCPPLMEVVYQFKNPDWIMTWSQPGETPEIARKLGNNRYGAKYWGDIDSLVVSGGDGGTDTEAKAKEYQLPAKGVQVYKSPGHYQDFFNCLRTREKPIMHIEAGHRVATLCILGNISYRLGRRLQWDPVAEKVIGDEQANLMLNRPGRGSWHL
jgi:predicted dehydrogenase